MKENTYRFQRPDELALVKTPKLTVAVIIACRNGQDKLDLVLASLAAQTYPSRLTSVYVIDDGSEQPLILGKIAPKNTSIVRFKNSVDRWGKTKATNEVVSTIKSDVYWFVDADMVFDKEHLSQHMKWHHNAEDYAVLGWKRFVKQWSYDAAELFSKLSQGGFDQLHSESWGKPLWEDRVDRTKDLFHPGLDGYRAFVGATFSLHSSLWRKIGGYNTNLVTGEDTELGWRLFMDGIRIVPERSANSWHLGYSTAEENKDLIDRHNQPSLAQYIPEMKKIRSKSLHGWKAPTYEVLIDVRDGELSQVLSIKSQLLSLPGTEARFALLGDWKGLRQRYSPVNDAKVNLREIYNWLNGDSNFDFIQVGDEHLDIESLIGRFKEPGAPFHVFIDASLAEGVNGKLLCDHLLSSENGLVGVVSSKDKRAFAVFHPALSRARSCEGATYKNIGELFGVSWMTQEAFDGFFSGKSYRALKIKNFIQREGKKINSPKQLVVFIGKIFSIVMRKILT